MSAASPAATPAVTLRRGGVRVALAAVAVVALLPLLFLVSLSLRSVDDIANGGWLPSRFVWSNFSAAFSTVPLSTMLANSWVVAVGATVLTSLVAVPAAYVTARAGARGERLQAVLLASYCAPPIVAVLPLYYLLKQADLTNTAAGLILVNGLANVPVAVWLLDGFVRRVPVEVEEAGWVDGLSTTGGLVRLVLPLLAPGLVAALLICLFLSYNEFLFAVSFSQSTGSQTLPVGLSLFQGDRTVQFGQQAAASLVGIVPMYVLAVVAQKWLVGGLSAGAVK
ncbi:carbohydrate ABC transporter permease [Kineococcus sp. LSe6-4]|uniref:Carbohydrate ABC transporter permease n=1 Tax=Kineococcus halophytocola TaxID=3234027 RepID=A0ABV4GY96_9ACTN